MHVIGTGRNKRKSGAPERDGRSRRTPVGSKEAGESTSSHVPPSFVPVSGKTGAGGAERASAPVQKATAPQSDPGARGTETATGTGSVPSQGAPASLVFSSLEVPRPDAVRSSGNEEGQVIHVVPTGAGGEDEPGAAETDRRARRARARAERKAAADAARTGKGGKKSKKSKKGKKGKRRRSKRKTPIWQIVLLAFGLALLAYPIVADRISAYQADQAITSYTEHVTDDPAEINRLLDQAQAYNDRLSGTPSAYEGEIPDQGQLIVPGDTAFAWIEFPTLAEKLPIYHGTDENSLQAGVGHLERTSMPIGGRSTHCVLTGHSGMPGNRMFDDIERLAVGDIFMIHVLNQDLAYKVISSEVVWPDETESLAIQPGRDLVTLITCTPYGVNDHRLLVHAERTDYDEALSLPQNNMALFFNQRTLPFILAIVVTVLFFTMLTVNRRRRYPRELGVDKAWNGLSDYTDDRRRFIGYDRAD